MQKALIGCLSAIILSSILAVIYSVTSVDPILKDSLKFSLGNLHYSLFTSIFIHNRDSHLQSNIIGMLIFGSLFFYYKGARRGCIYYIIAGVIGHLGEIIFSIPLNYLLRLYLEGFKDRDLSNVGFWIFPPSGAGASGALMGIMIIVSYESLGSLIQSYKEFRNDSDSEKDKWFDFFVPKNMIKYVLPFILPIALSLERIVADLDRFFTILWQNFFQHVNPDFLTVLTSFLVEIIPSLNPPGNPFLAHVFGLVGGMTILLFEVFLQNREKK